jgi:hypothetical protein
MKPVPRLAIEHSNKSDDQNAVFKVFSNGAPAKGNQKNPLILAYQGEDHDPNIKQGQLAFNQITPLLSLT